MSERVRQSVLSSLYGSKRIIVAACAAIAMVLGAMSVGASVFTGESNPGSQDNEISSISAATGDTHGNVSEEKNSDLTTQHALETRNIMSEQPANTPSPTPHKLKKSTLSEILISSANAALFVSQVPLLEQLQSQLQAKAEADTTAAEEAAQAAVTATPTESSVADEESSAAEPADSGDDPAAGDTENRSSTDTGGTLLDMADSAEAQ